MNDIPASESNPIPFVQRGATYAHLKQHILDPPEPRAYSLTGRTGIGKSTLLQQFDTVFDDTILSVYIPLQSLDLDDATHWWEWLNAATNQLLQRHDFSLTRIAQFTPDDAVEDYAAWFTEEYLPEVLHVIRPHRQLVWLVDDAEHLPNVDDELPTMLYTLLQTHNQLSIIVALNTDYDDAFPHLAPLIAPTRSERLHPLTYDALHDTLHDIAPGITDDAVQNVFDATGGYPPLVREYINQLMPLWGRADESDAIATAQAHVYDTSKPIFREQWLQLERDERLVLTAIISLIYDDPLRPVTTKRIETWLIETDFPMDTIAINAALRGLDFRGIIRNEPSQVQPIIGLQQQWLLEFARLDDRFGINTGSEGWQWYWWLLVAALILIAVGIIVLLGLPTVETPGSVPTVTLGS